MENMEDSTREGGTEYDEPPIKLDTSLDTWVIIDNVPEVGKEKLGKLEKVLRDKLERQDFPVVSLHMPWNADGTSTCGFCFVEFENKETASRAARDLAGFKFDKQHPFDVTPMEEYEKFLGVPNEYEQPPPPVLGPREFLLGWMLDEQARDQYLVRYGEMTEIFWNGPNGKPIPEYRRKAWTENHVAWSPRGTYLATFHRMGIAVWGGDQFKRINRFQHIDVSYADFSPCETYLITCSLLERDNKQDPQSIIVWDVRTGKKLRGLLGPKPSMGTRNWAWPVAKWSHDDKYMARLSDDGKRISIFEAPSMKKVDEIRRDDVKDFVIKEFCWSPSDNYLSYWVPEIENAPARVSIFKIPGQTEVRQKNLFSVKDVKMHWQEKGDYLCVKVDRTTKSKKTTFTNFELFCIREKEVPVEVLDLKEPVAAFAWEPVGSRFVIVHGEPPRPNVSFYSMNNFKQGTLSPLKTIEGKPVNHVFWSPRGRFVILAGLKNLNGQLEWWDAETGQMLASDEHFMCTDIVWDPTGRFVATFVSAWQHSMENGYTLWSFRGHRLYRTTREKFYQLIWRPRPPSLLKDEDEKKIMKNLKEYSRRYDERDEERRRQEVSGVRAERIRQLEEFNCFLSEKRKAWQADHDIRVELRNGYCTDEEADYVEYDETHEEVVSQKEDPYKGS